MGIWSLITGADKVGDVIDTGLGVVKSGVSALDKMVYTDEEKAIAGAENVIRNMDHAYKFAQLAQSESGASAITRRLAMLIVLGNFTLYSVVGMILVLMDKINTLQNLIEFSRVMGIAMLATTVVASMFGYYAYTKGKYK